MSKNESLVVKSVYDQKGVQLRFCYDPVENSLSVYSRGQDIDGDAYWRTVFLDYSKSSFALIGALMRRIVNLENNEG